MRKIILLLCVSLIFSLTACGKNEKPIKEEIIEEPIVEEVVEEITTEEEIEKKEIDESIIDKHLASNSKDYYKRTLSEALSNYDIEFIDYTNGGESISLYTLDNSLYQINLEYISDSDYSIYYCADNIYYHGFLNPQDIGIPQSLMIRDGDKRIEVSIENGGFEWGLDDHEERIEDGLMVYLVNDTIIYKYEDSNSYCIPITLGNNEYEIIVRGDVDISAFKLDSIQILSSFVGYDYVENTFTDIKDFSYLFPVSYGEKFASQMRVKYQNSTDYTIKFADLDDGEPHFSIVSNEYLDKSGDLEYWTTIEFSVIDEKEFNEEYDKVGETSNYLVYARKFEIEKDDINIYLFIPKDNSEYRLTNTAYVDYKFSGIPIMRVYDGEEIPEEETFKIAEQFSFNIENTIDYSTYER